MFVPTVKIERVYLILKFSGIISKQYYVVCKQKTGGVEIWYSETSLIRHSLEPENIVGLGGCWIIECLLPYLCMVTVPHIMVGLERMLDYRGVGLARFTVVCLLMYCWDIQYKYTSTCHCIPCTYSCIQTHTHT